LLIWSGDTIARHVEGHTRGKCRRCKESKTVPALARRIRNGRSTCEIETPGSMMRDTKLITDNGERVARGKWPNCIKGPLRHSQGQSLPSAGRSPVNLNSSDLKLKGRWGGKPRN